jgi:hypothetical protein
MRFTREVIPYYDVFASRKKLESEFYGSFLPLARQGDADYYDGYDLRGFILMKKKSPAIRRGLLFIQLKKYLLLF